MSKITMVRIEQDKGAQYSWGFCDTESLGLVTRLANEHGMEFGEVEFSKLRKGLEAAGVAFKICYISRPVFEFELTGVTSQYEDSRQAAEAPAIQ